MSPRWTTRRQFLEQVTVLSGGGVLALGLGHHREALVATSPGPPVDYSGEVAVAHLTAVVGPAPFHVATGAGFFEDRGLDLSLVSFPGGSDTVRGMQSGMDVGLPATISAVIGYHKGVDDLRFVGGCFNGAQVLFLVPADSPLQKPEDIAGKKVAVSGPTSISTYFANRIASELGLEPGADVEIINVGGPPDAWTAASEGVVDVAWSSPPLSSILVADGDARLLMHTKDYAESWADQVLVATESILEDDPDVVQALVDAIGDACTMIRDDTTAAAELFAAAIDVEVGVAEDALRDPGLESWSTEFDLDGIQATVDAAIEMGEVSEGFDVSEMIVDDFAP